jgi:hypothetical protein
MGDLSLCLCKKEASIVLVGNKKIPLGEKCYNRAIDKGVKMDQLVSVTELKRAIGIWTRRKTAA